MLKIQDAVNAVFSAMRLRGYRENTLEHLMWSVYKPIINYHYDNGAELCSDELLGCICGKQAVRCENGEISRKRYREFVTAVFRICSYAATGEVDFSIVKTQNNTNRERNIRRLLILS